MEALFVVREIKKVHEKQPSFSKYAEKRDKKSKVRVSHQQQEKRYKLKVRGPTEKT